MSIELNCIIDEDINPKSIKDLSIMYNFSVSSMRTLLCRPEFSPFEVSDADKIRLGLSRRTVYFNYVHAFVSIMDSKSLGLKCRKKS